MRRLHGVLMHEFEEEKLFGEAGLSQIRASILTLNMFTRRVHCSGAENDEDGIIQGRYLFRNESTTTTFRPITVHQ